jgi:rRNA-processing protein FCF1
MARRWHERRPPAAAAAPADAPAAGGGGAAVVVLDTNVIIRCLKSEGFARQFFADFQPAPRALVVVPFPVLRELARNVRVDAASLFGGRRGSVAERRALWRRFSRLCVAHRWRVASPLQHYPARGDALAAGGGDAVARGGVPSDAADGDILLYTLALSRATAALSPHAAPRVVVVTYDAAFAERLAASGVATWPPPLQK